MTEAPESPQASSASSGRWLEPLPDWPAAVQLKLQSEFAVARVVVAAVRGSAPRECGACMLIGARECSGTIGGGHLEWAAIEAARALLDQQAVTACVRKFVLGSDLAQCCGGVVELWIEKYTRDDLLFLDSLCAAARRSGTRLMTRLTAEGVGRSIVTGNARALHRAELTCSPTETVLVETIDEAAPSIYLYGAGHVGQALARVLATLPLRTTWIDSRRELLPDDMHRSLNMVHATQPLLTLASAPPRSHFIVMTHHHALDYALCRTILQRGEFASLGVIGSKSKAARFRSRLARDGLSASQIAALRCPIGIDGLRSKVPAVIAIAVAAQLLQAIEAHAAAPMRGSQALPPCDAAGAGCMACELLHQAS